MTDDRATQGLEALQDQVAESEQQTIKLKTVANNYAATFGLSVPYPDVGNASAAGASTAIRPDQFANHAAPSTAARAYLEWRGEKRGAASADEIFDALVKGGFMFENKNTEEAKSGLRVALGKDGMIHKLPNGYYGLVAWYPDAKKKKKDGKKDETPTPPQTSATGTKENE